MDIQEAVAVLNGSEYGKEGTNEFFETMYGAGFVAVFCASDCVMVFRGAIEDKIECFNGGTIYLNHNGPVVNECDEDCPNFDKIKQGIQTIKAVWCQDSDNDINWRYETDIPHEVFDVLKDGTIYCRGILFRTTDMIEMAEYILRKPHTNLKSGYSRLLHK